MRPSTKLAIGATAVATVLGGCGLTGDDSEQGEQNDNVESGSAPDSEETIGEGTFDHEGTEVTLEINGLTERDDLLQLDYTITYGDPDSAGESTNVRQAFGAGSSNEDMYLIDSANLNRHWIVEDDGGTTLEPDPWETDLVWGEPTQMTAYFASTADMESADVHIYDLPPIMDVPVTKADTEEGE